MPPTSIDGTDITGATIDGTDVTEITVDGDTVFTAETLPVAFSNPVAWYPFDSAEYGGSNADDVTAIIGGSGDDTAYDGTVSGATYQSSGGVTDIRAGANSGAFDYSGSDRITVNGAGIKLTTQTAMAWLRWDTINGSVPFFHADSNGSTNGWRVDLNPNGNTIQVFYKDSNEQTSVDTGSYTQSDWVHIALTTNGTNGTLEAFRNGSSKGSFSYDNYNPTSDDLSIGRATATFFDPFDGKVDDVRIYNTALSQSQIDNIYQNTKP